MTQTSYYTQRQASLSGSPAHTDSLPPRRRVPRGCPETACYGRLPRTADQAAAVGRSPVRGRRASGCLRWRFDSLIVSMPISLAALRLLACAPLCVSVRAIARARIGVSFFMLSNMARCMPSTPIPSLKPTLMMDCSCAIVVSLTCWTRKAALRSIQRATWLFQVQHRHAVFLSIKPDPCSDSAVR